MVALEQEREDDHWNHEDILMRSHESKLPSLELSCLKTQTETQTWLQLPSGAVFFFFAFIICVLSTYTQVNESH